MAASARWVVLERVDWPSDMNYRVAFFANVPAARQPFYADATLTSEWKTMPAGDITQLQAGGIVELVETVRYQAGTPTNTIVQDLDTKQVDFQALITSKNLWDRYGTRRNADNSLTSAGVA